MAWTKERVARLKLLRKAGLTYTQIAADLGEGVTRNAVAGAVNRFETKAPLTAPLPEKAKLTLVICSKPEPKQLELPKSSMVLSPIIKDVVTSVYVPPEEPKRGYQPSKTSFSFGNVVFGSTKNNSKAKALYDDLRQAVVNTRSLQDKMDGK